MNTDNQTPKQHPKESPGAEQSAPRHVLTFGQRMRAYFFAGILVIAPISITLYLAWLFIGFVDSKITPLIPLKYNPESYLPFALPGLGLLILVLGLMLTGALTAGFMGRLWVRFSERALARMPVIRNIYSAVKQIFETVRLHCRSPNHEQTIAKMFSSPQRCILLLCVIIIILSD